MLEYSDLKKHRCLDVIEKMKEDEQKFGIGEISVKMTGDVVEFIHVPQTKIYKKERSKMLTIALIIAIIVGSLACIVFVYKLWRAMWP